LLLVEAGDDVVADGGDEGLGEVELEEGGVVEGFVCEVDGVVALLCGDEDVVF